jgi:hypothetical protein
LPDRRGRGRALAAWAAVVAVAVAAAPLVSPSNDDLYALAWGGELWRGHLPDVGASLLPVDHPLNLLASALLTPLGPSGARYAFSALSLVALAALVYASFRLGRRVGGVTVGLIAAVLVATRSQVVLWGWAAVVDVPFAALTMLAAALAADDPQRNRWRVLGLLVAAGLLRPEAWALSLLYAAWLVTRIHHPGERAAIVACALAAPLLWGAFDAVLTGDPLHSLHAAGGAHRDANLHAADFSTQGPAEGPRPSGLARLGDSLSHVIGWPLLALGAAGAVLALRHRSRTAPAEVALAVVALAGSASFVVLNLVGLPANNARYLLLPGIALVVLAAGMVGLARSSRPAAWGVGIAMVALLALLPFDIAYMVRNFGTQRDRFDAGRQAADAVSGTHSRSVLALCPRLVVGGTRRRFAHAGRAMAAAQLRRDPADVELRRLPATPPGTSAIAYVSFGGVRPGTWRFASACSGELGVLPPASRAGAEAAHVVLEELRHR